MCVLRLLQPQNVGQIQLRSFDICVCVIILGTAWHGPSGEAGIGLMDQERGGSWLVHELKQAETSLIPVVSEHG
jgi:hypothetical protein